MELLTTPVTLRQDAPSPAPIDDNVVDAASRTVGEAVQELLKQQGVPEHQHNATVGRILGLGAGQGRRKLMGVSKINVGELRALADELRVPPSTLVAGLDRPGRDLGEKVAAEFMVDGQALHCTAWLGPEILPSDKSALVAEGAPGSLYRVLKASAATRARVRSVLRVDMHLPQPHVPRIAVLDDHEDSCDNLRDYLNMRGMSAEAFYSVPQLADRLDAALNEFDGYVMDWHLGGLTCEGLIAAARRIRPDVPIILLTGQVSDEMAMAEVISRYNLTFYEKPFRLPIIAASLERSLVSGR